jgi:chromosome segregation ATPase
MAEIDVVKIGLTDLKDTIDGLNASLSDNTAKLATTKVELADYNSKIKEAEKELKTLQASTEADNATIEAQKAKIIELNQQREMAKIAIKEQTKAVNENIAMIQAGNTARDAESGSMAQMKANLKLVNFEINNMSANERDASEAGATLKAQSLELTNKYSSKFEIQ